MVYSTTMEKELTETNGQVRALTRASRLRRLRNLANLSRKELCQKSGININTLIGWEVGRHGGLTKAGARKFLDSIRAEGVICSEEWLLEGCNIEPYIIPAGPLFTDIDPESQLQQILEEIALLKTHHPDSVSIIIEDDSMMPIFKKTDLVCGRVVAFENIKPYLGECCIVLTENGSQMLRTITLGEDENTLSLLASNLSAESLQPLMLQNIKPIYVAPVIWHRKFLKTL